MNVYDKTQVHVDLQVGMELRSPLHFDSDAFPCPCPSPFRPLAQADSSLPVLLRQRLCLVKRDGQVADHGHGVDQRMGAGANAVENVSPLPHYDSSASQGPSNVPRPLYPLAPPHRGRLFRSQDDHLAADAVAVAGQDVDNAYSPLHFGYAVSPSP